MRRNRIYPLAKIRFEFVSLKRFKIYLFKWHAELTDKEEADFGDFCY